jgi:hypothetical protein
MLLTMTWLPEAEEMDAAIARKEQDVRADWELSERLGAEMLEDARDVIGLRVVSKSSLAVVLHLLEGCTTRAATAVLKNRAPTRRAEGARGVPGLTRTRRVITLHRTTAISQRRKQEDNNAEHKGASV